MKWLKKREQRKNKVLFQSLDTKDATISSLKNIIICLMIDSRFILVHGHMFWSKHRYYLRNIPSTNISVKSSRSIEHAHHDSHWWSVLMSWSNAEALSNMDAIMFTEDVSHALISWSKVGAVKNILFMLVTEDTFHALMFWLKTLAELNMEFTSVTKEVSHALMFWLKAVAPPNMEPMLVTEEVSHTLIGLLIL